MLIALGAAGVTLAVVLGVIGIPVVNACSADPRGVVTCLRDMADRKFDLPGTIPGRSAENVPVPVMEHAEPTVVVDLPPPVPPPGLQASDPEAIPSSAQEQPMVVAEAPEAAPAAPAIASTPEAAPAEPPPAAVELAAAPEAPAVPATAPASDTPADTALTWTAPPPADLGPPLVAPVAEEPKSETPPASNPPSIAAAPEPARAPELTTAAVAPSQSAPALAAPPGTIPPQPVFDLANAEPVEARAPAPVIAAPMILAPTIDAIELDGAQSFVSGSGPAGALMRLYADGELIGESPVEEGRWLVEGRNLLDSPRSELRVEAIEPQTGKLLGFAAISVEIELPEGGAPPDERPAETPEFGSGVAPPDEAEPVPAQQASAPAESNTQPPEPASTIADASDIPPPADAPIVAAPEPPTVSTPTGEPELATVPDAEPEPLPELAAVAPQRESASVEILGPPETEPSVLPPISAITHDPATITLDPPGAPALVADLAVPPPPPPGKPVTILRLLRFGDPDSGRYNVGKAIIRHGDTLWSLARRYYGHGIHYRTIFHANRDQIGRPSRIFPGQVFDLPLVTDD